MDLLKEGKSIMNIRDLIKDPEDLAFVQYLFEDAGGSSNIIILDQDDNIEYEWWKDPAFKHKHRNRMLSRG